MEEGAFMPEDLKMPCNLGLLAHVSSHKPNFDDWESVLTLLYEAYAECNIIDDGTIKEDFNELYRLKNSIPSGIWVKSSASSVRSAGITRNLVL